MIDHNVIGDFVSQRFESLTVFECQIGVVD